VLTCWADPLDNRWRSQPSYSASPASRFCFLVRRWFLATRACAARKQVEHCHTHRESVSYLIENQRVAPSAISDDFNASLIGPGGEQSRRRRVFQMLRAQTVVDRISRIEGKKAASCRSRCMRRMITTSIPLWHPRFSLRAQTIVHQTQIRLVPEFPTATLTEAPRRVSK